MKRKGENSRHVCNTLCRREKKDMGEEKREREGRMRKNIAEKKNKGRKVARKRKISRYKYKKKGKKGENIEQGSRCDMKGGRKERKN